MRPLEILLSLANILAFLALVVPGIHAQGWARFVPPAALLIAAAEALIEGPRWQMAPAYGLALTFALVGLGGEALRAGRIGAAAAGALGVLALIVAMILPVFFPVFHFPKPGGPYAIGTTTYHWVDQSRPELFTADPSDHRQLMAQVWYPAKAMPGAPRAPYMADADSLTPYLGRVLHMPEFLFAHFRYVTGNAVEDAPPAEDQPAYPVLIYLSGLGGQRQVNTAQTEALVSQGYIVVGIDQPGGSAAVILPDGQVIAGTGRAINPLINQSGWPQDPIPELNGAPMPEGIIPYFGQDATSTIDQLEKLNQADPKGLLTGRIDLARVGVFGISLGAIDGAQACAKDARIKACLLMDGFVPRDAMNGNLKTPTMFITRPADTMRLERARSGGWAEQDIAITLDTMKAAYKSLPGDGYYIDMPTMFHINFTDAPYWLPFGTLVGLTGPIDGRRGWEIVNAYSVAFFDRELKGKTSPLLEGQTFPEATIQIRRP